MNNFFEQQNYIEKNNMDFQLFFGSYWNLHNSNVWQDSLKVQQAQEALFYYGEYPVIIYPAFFNPKQNNWNQINVFEQMADDQISQKQSNQQLFSQTSQKNSPQKLLLLCEQLKQQLTCPIACSLMQNPVILKTCGHSYQQQSLRKWLKYERKCPMCKITASSSDILPNYQVKGVLDSYLELEKLIKNKQAEVFPKSDMIYFYIN